MKKLKNWDLKIKISKGVVGLGSSSSSPIYELGNFGELLNTAGPQFSQQKNGDENSTRLPRLL